MKYEHLKQTPSDINEHLEIIKHYSAECEIVAEFGTREVVSTWAILEGLKPKTTYIGVDVYKSTNLEMAKNYAKEKGINFYFKHGSTLEEDFNLGDVDFLFIDTLHTYNQLSMELNKHGNVAKKYLGFHDVVSSPENEGNNIFVSKFWSEIKTQYIDSYEFISDKSTNE
jgi:hypothetical protein